MKSVSPLENLPLDVRHMIAGRLTSPDVGALARTSSRMHAAASPVLADRRRVDRSESEMMKRWRSAIKTGDSPLFLHILENVDLDVGDFGDYLPEMFVLARNGPNHRIRRAMTNILDEASLYQALLLAKRLNDPVSVFCLIAVARDGASWLAEEALHIFQ
jgi:hypothetical protein